MRMIDQQHEFTACERAICRYLAKVKDRWYHDNYGHNPTQGPRPSLEYLYIAMLAERAFSALFNVAQDLSGYGGDFDCMLPDGRRVDVKGIQPPNRLLTCYSGMRHGADLYALMRGTEHAMTFRGFMAAEELIQRRRLRELVKGRQKPYCAEPGELVELDEISALRVPKSVVK